MWVCVHGKISPGKGIHSCGSPRRGTGWYDGSWSRVPTILWERLARTVIYAAMGEDRSLRGQECQKTSGGVAVARKLAVLMHHLWVTGEVYKPLHNTHRQAS